MPYSVGLNCTAMGSAFKTETLVRVAFWGSMSESNACERVSDTGDHRRPHPVKSLVCELERFDSNLIGFGVELRSLKAFRERVAKKPDGHRKAVDDRKAQWSRPATSRGEPQATIG